jgi:hypothetical protein
VKNCYKFSQCSPFWIKLLLTDSCFIKKSLNFPLPERRPMPHDLAREPVRSAAAPAIDGTSPDTGGRRLTGLARPALFVAGGMPRQRRCGQFLARAARPRSGAPVV